MEESLIKPLNLSRFGEDEACKFLRKKKLKILDRNYRAPSGELDVIAASGKTIIFIEVKTRSSSDFAQPWEAVGYTKRKNIKSAARWYIQHHRLGGREYRFDIISILINDALKPEIEWIQDAFQ